MRHLTPAEEEMETGRPLHVSAITEMTFAIGIPTGLLCVVRAGEHARRFERTNSALHRGDLRLIAICDAFKCRGFR